MYIYNNINIKSGNQIRNIIYIFSKENFKNLSLYYKIIIWQLTKLGCIIKNHIVLFHILMQIDNIYTRTFQY
jgi:hypothetical protein